MASVLKATGKRVANECSQQALRNPVKGVGNAVAILGRVRRERRPLTAHWANAVRWNARGSADACHTKGQHKRVIERCFQQRRCYPMRLVELQVEAQNECCSIANKWLK